MVTALSASSPRFDLVEGVGLGVVPVEVARHVLQRPSRGTPAGSIVPMSAPPWPGLDPRGVRSARAAAAGRASWRMAGSLNCVQVEAARPSRAGVRLDGSTWRGSSAAWSTRVGRAAAQAVLLVHEQHRAHGPARASGRACAAGAAPAIATTTPAPSSRAPWPTSHESRWPPMTTISSGCSRPAHLADHVGRPDVGQRPAPSRDAAP